jgi:hypothetical protein
LLTIFHRHERFHCAANPLDHQAGRRIPNHQRRTRGAAFQHSRSRVQVESRHLQGLTMALEAPLDNRKNVFFRERTLLSGRAVLENQQHRQKRNHRPKSLANL